MQARFYAPMYGRFLSPDPARDQHFEQTQSWNIYSYVQNDPTMRIDPTGMAVQFNDQEAYSQFKRALSAMLPPGERSYIYSQIYKDGSVDVLLLIPLPKQGESPYKGSEEFERLRTVIDASARVHIREGTSSGKSGEVLLPTKADGSEVSSGERFKSISIDLGMAKPKLKDDELGETTIGANQVTGLQFTAGTLAHELLGHVYLYLADQGYQHAKKGEPPSTADKDIEAIEKKARENARTPPTK